MASTLSMYISITELFKTAFRANLLQYANRNEYIDKAVALADTDEQREAARKYAKELLSVICPRPITDAELIQHWHKLDQEYFDRFEREEADLAISLKRK